MALYLALIYEDEAGWRKGGPVAEAGSEAHRAFGERHAGIIASGHALQSTGTAKSVRRDADSGFVVTDGPWTESKETLGGYYLFEAPDLDAALEIAKQVPAPFGGVELRPIMVFE